MRPIAFIVSIVWFVIT